MTIADEVEDPIANLLFGLRAFESKRQYPQLLKMFLDFISKGTLDEQAKQFLMLTRESGNSRSQFETIHNISN
jgi:hypothetical protein